MWHFHERKFEIQKSILSVIDKNVDFKLNRSIAIKKRNKLFPNLLFAFRFLVSFHNVCLTSTKLWNNIFQGENKH